MRSPQAKIVAIFLAVGLLTTLVACGEHRDKGCPEGAVAAVIWSSETARLSRIQFVDNHRVLASRPLAVQGVSPSKPAVVQGKYAYLLATGNPKKSRTDLLRIDLETCASAVIPLPSGPGYSFTAASGYNIVTVSPGKNTTIYFTDVHGSVLRTLELPNQFVTAVAADGSRVFAFAQDERATSTAVLEIDADSAEIRRHIPLPGVGSSPISIVIHENSLYVPITLISEKVGGEDNRVIRVDLQTYQVSTITLPRTLPHLADAGRKGLVIAHTFLNPAFGPISGHRHITKIDWNTHEVTEGDIDLGIDSMHVTGDTLLILGVDENEDPYLGSYDLATLATISRVPLGTSDQWGEYHYPADVLPLISG